VSADVVAPHLSTESVRVVDAWRRHDARLLTCGVVSVIAAIALWIAAASPDGRDAFYVAIAIEFIVWGTIDAFFAIAGKREIARMNMLDAEPRDAAFIAKGETLRRLLRINHWLNALWLSIGVGLLVWGYLAWSASLVGHGTGVLSQAIVLTILDFAFIRALRPRSA
jgi:ABC-type transport system involved in cytochrome bd biosynthesis fused ATPase/permease subunit